MQIIIVIIIIIIIISSSISMVQQALVGQGLLIIEASQSHCLRHTLGRTPLDE
jgi:hypothetical protein